MSDAKILIVEDEMLAALSLQETLENFGYEVTGLATNREETIESIESNTPDLVLMDINLDEKQEGITVGKDIMRKYALPVIFLTAFMNNETISKAKEAFPYGYMAKPYLDMELFAMIETAIYKHLADKSQKDLNKTKDKFFSVVAHDLRSPLAALEVTTRMLNKKFDVLSREEIKDFISEVHDTIKNIYSFTDNLLQWATLQRGQFTVYPEEFYLESLIEEAFCLLEAKAIEKNITLTLIKDFVPNEPVEADKHMVRSVLLNLIQNSIKFSKPGKEVIVRVRKNGSVSEISVKDMGVGMSVNQLKTLFNFSTQKSTLGTQEEKGTGLGLLLCKEFIELNNGQIFVKSTKGRGTEVIFQLPLHLITK